MAYLTTPGLRLNADGYIFELTPQGWMVSAGGAKQWLSDAFHPICQTAHTEAYSAFPTQAFGLLIVPDDCKHFWTVPMAALDHAYPGLGNLDIHFAFKEMGLRLVGGSEGSKLMVRLLRSAHADLEGNAVLQQVRPGVHPQKCSELDRALFSCFIKKDRR